MLGNNTNVFSSPGILSLCIILVLSGCSFIAKKQFESAYGKSQVVDRWVTPESEPGQHYHQKIKPIIENRCVVCHACYDAPCQLKLNSAAGIDRGANKQSVYNPTRLLAASTSRLFIDAETTQDWRNMDFFPVLNEFNQAPEANREGSLIYQSLTLKKQHPLPQQALLPDTYDVSLARKNECPRVEEYRRYAEKFPQNGMPYGLPGLSNEEHNTIVAWLESGALLPHRPTLPQEYLDSIAQWENFFNQDSLKAQLVMRYVYEHLFLVNIYFSDLVNANETERFFFKLVRSTTPPGEPIDIIATRRPYDDPGVARVYYRLQQIESSIVAKTHIPYALSNERMEWLDNLFLRPNYTVSELPSYDEKAASNPFTTFKDIPTQYRYKFMLKEAKAIIDGFIKGPVCRGQTALNVINDHFWVFFVNPDTKVLDQMGEFLQEQANNLRMPTETTSNSLLLSNWIRFSKLQTQYTLAKSDALEAIFPGGKFLDLDLVWDGEQQNDNAALTVMRHFDSASVVKGLVGPAPKTAWLIDYPIFERIHYLLVAGYDVYGNIGHQLNTRLYMDFLRFESEYNFLALLPKYERVRLRDYWYRDASIAVKDHLYRCKAYLDQPPSINYSSDKPQFELYDLLKQKLAPVTAQNYQIDFSKLPSDTAKHFRNIMNVSGASLSLMPEINLIIMEDETGNSSLYTLLRNSAHSNIATLFRETSTRLPEEDTVSLVPGVLGAYPGAYWHVKVDTLGKFVEHLSTLQTEEDYSAFKNKYGVRRTHTNFWHYSDRVHDLYQASSPLEFGLLDYNRLENR